MTYVKAVCGFYGFLESMLFEVRVALVVIMIYVKSIIKRDISIASVLSMVLEASVFSEATVSPVSSALSLVFMFSMDLYRTCRFYVTRVQRGPFRQRNVLTVIFTIFCNFL